MRCGVHAGVDERRDNDFYGNAVNRAARVMTSAHGGQILRVADGRGADPRPPAGTDVSLLDLGTVRLRGLTQPEQVYQVVHRGAARRTFPALRMLEETPHNLPQPLTSFVGREHELAEGKRQLAHTRLLTLLGIGGLGKSRLSLAGRRPTCSTIIPTASGSSSSRRSPTRGSCRRRSRRCSASRRSAGHPVRDALVEVRARPRSCCSCSTTASTWRRPARRSRASCSKPGPHDHDPRLEPRAPATSRGEKAYSLAPLAVPLPRSRSSRRTRSRSSPAVRLFVERAAAANSDFALTTDNAAAVVGDLSSAGRHSARARARRRARARDVGAERSPSA